MGANAMIALATSTVEAISAAVVIMIAVATAFSFIHAKTKRIAREDLAASNARVLREYKRMTMHNPEKIVNLTGYRRGDRRRELRYEDR